MVFWPIHFLLVWIERVRKFFLIWPVNNQGRARFCSVGAVGECAKHAYAPSPATHNAFFYLGYSWPDSKNFRYFLSKQEGTVLTKKASHASVPLMG